MILSSSRLEATNTLIQTKTEIGIREARGLTEKDRWTIKRDGSLRDQWNETKKLYYTKVLWRPFASASLLTIAITSTALTCSLRVKINNGRKGVHTRPQSERESLRLPVSPCPPITPISLFLQSHPVSVLLPTTDGGELGRIARLNKRYGIRE